MTPEKYAKSGHRHVKGWLGPEAAVLITALARSSAAVGSVGEIGVHHGRLFLLLNLLRRPGETAVAVDVFGQQELNIDNSGRGDRAVFEANLRRFTPDLEVHIQEADSTTITPEQLLAWSGSPYRLFSVDGGHTAAITESDLRVSSGALADGGLLILDDYFNGQFPGVWEGTNRFLQSEPRVVAFGSAHGKTFFTTPEAAETYRTAMRETGRRNGWVVKDSTFFGQVHVVAWTQAFEQRALGAAKRVARRVPAIERYVISRK